MIRIQKYFNTDVKTFSKSAKFQLTCFFVEKYYFCIKNKNVDS